jgi:hypothetical protein
MPKRPPVRSATVHLPPDPHRVAKAAAAHAGLPLQDWIAAALAAELARHPARPQISRPHAVSQELRDLVATGGTGR